MLANHVEVAPALLGHPVDARARNTRPRFSGPDHRPNRRSRRANARRCKAGSTTTRYDCSRPFVFLNNRHHNPELGVFTSVDPLATTTGQPSIDGAATRSPAIPLDVRESGFVGVGHGVDVEGLDGRLGARLLAGEDQHR